MLLEASIVIPLTRQFPPTNLALEPAVLDKIRRPAVRAATKNHRRRELARVFDTQGIQSRGNRGPRLGFRTEAGRLVRDRDDRDLFRAAIKLERHFPGRKHWPAACAGHMLAMPIRDPQPVGQHDKRDDQRAVRLLVCLLIKPCE